MEWNSVRKGRYRRLEFQELLHRAIRLANGIPVIARTREIRVRKRNPPVRVIP